MRSEERTRKAEEQRQKLADERKAILDRMTGIKISPKPTEKQFMPTDWQDRLPKATLDALDASARRHNVPRELLARILWQESEFKEDSRSAEPTGKAKGIAGLKDGPMGVKAELQRVAGLNGNQARVRELAAYDELNAAQAVDMAAEYLRQSYEQGGKTWPGAVAAYNFGPPAFGAWINGKGDPTKSRTLSWGMYEMFSRAIPRPSINVRHTLHGSILCQLVDDWQ